MQSIPFWRKNPFIRLLIPLVIGIIIQWYHPCGLRYLVAIYSCLITGLILFQFLPLASRFNFTLLNGLLINLLVCTTGMLTGYLKDVRNNNEWVGRSYTANAGVIVDLIEDPSLKANSFKSEAKIENVQYNHASVASVGKIVIYFQSDSCCSLLHYGDRLLIHKPLQEIKNPGNPGGFDYAQYCAFKGIFHQVYLRKNEWQLLKGTQQNFFIRFLLEARKRILLILRQNMPGDQQLSIAEALLIGYTDDLDKNLVQAYSNTGVVHIIAISGMHIGLIYSMLLWLFKRIPYIRRFRILEVIFIVSGIWLFALLTGGCPSILRAAVMFSFLVIGRSLSKRSSIYNSLAASACILLCYNPFYLWDVGFQLSYLALAGIVIFFKPIYKILFFKNKGISKIWELTAVSLAAQVLTFPVCLYYFHQFPLLFLITNLISVPLSTIILFIEIVFILVGWISFAGVYLGKITWLLVMLMNKIILFFNELPYSIVSQVTISFLEMIFIYSAVLSGSYWVIFKSRSGFKISILSLGIFFLMIAKRTWLRSIQKKIIVYNIPHQSAMDLIKGCYYYFDGDSAIAAQHAVQNYSLNPARIALGITKPMLVTKINNLYLFENTRILIINRDMHFITKEKINIDLVIISGNPSCTISQVAEYIRFETIVFDASNNLWKIANWKKECELLHLRCHSVPGEGAFILDL